MSLLLFMLSLAGAYVACMGFGFIFHLRGKLLLITPLGSVLLWAVYLLLQDSVPNIVVRSLIATMVAAVFCEIIARVMRVPVTVFMIIAILPLVPGSGIYYSMESCIRHDYNTFLQKGVETIGIAGAIAVGMLLISGVFRLSTTLIRRLRQFSRQS